MLERNHVNVTLSTGQLVVALLLVVLNGFFVVSEFAFVQIRGTSVEQLAAEGRTGAATLQEEYTETRKLHHISGILTQKNSLSTPWWRRPTTHKNF